MIFFRPEQVAPDQRALSPSAFKPSPIERCATGMESRRRLPARQIRQYRAGAETPPQHADSLDVCLCKPKVILISHRKRK